MKLAIINSNNDIEAIRAMKRHWSRDSYPSAMVVEIQLHKSFGIRVLENGKEKVVKDYLALLKVKLLK
ncbi:hypothetical protein Tco_0586946 [Tanacetum coccineum]